MWQSLIIISVGAALGACTRWGLGLMFNSVASYFSMGTLVANYLGCFIIGVISALIWHYPAFSSEWRLFLVTGFLGSLTTFSAFSAEVIEKLVNQQWNIGIFIMLIHIIGCLLMTGLGIILFRFFIK